MPPVSWPIASIFWACSSRLSVSMRAAISVRRVSLVRSSSAVRSWTRCSKWSRAPESSATSTRFSSCRVSECSSILCADRPCPASMKMNRTDISPMVM